MVSAEPRRDEQSMRGIHTYHALTLAAPVLLPIPLCIAEISLDRPSSLAAVVCLVVLATQQLTALVHREVLPGTNWALLARIPKRWSGLALLVLGAGLGLIVTFIEVDVGGPVWLWCIPPSVSFAILALDVLRAHEQQQPAGASILVLVGIAVATTALFAGRPSSPDESATLLVQAGGALAMTTVVIVGQALWFATVAELAATKALAVEHAVIAERLRFAGELHDLQGLELQKIMLHADLGQALIDSMDRDPDAVAKARECLLSIRTAATDALAETRSVAKGFRKVNFALELANTVNVLQAAGVTVVVTGSAEAITGEFAHLAGLTLRESGTNLMRHSLARNVTIDIQRDGDNAHITITDPGPRRQSETKSEPGTGLSSLRSRAAAESKVLTSAKHGDGWRVALRGGASDASPRDR